MVLGSVATMAQGPAKQPRREIFDWGVYSAEPAIEASLQLSEEQNKKIDVAVRETVWSQAIGALHAKSKDQNLSEAERKAASDEHKAERAKARSEYKNRLAEILTEPQKALVGKLNEAASAAHREVKNEYTPKLTGLEGDERQKVLTEISDKTKIVAAEKIRAALTPEQAEALAKAK
jgi:Spy/CpxP family protein refolding chaperone